MHIEVSHDDMQRFRRRLTTLYPDHVDAHLERLRMVFGRYGVGVEKPRDLPRWTEKDVALITYADILQADDCPPLAALNRFATEHLKGAIRTIHLLPFYPWTSDDGFSVVDYRQVHPDYGDWKNVDGLGNEFDLMFDVVLNHCSTSSSWFRQFIQGNLPGREYFVEESPDTDLSQVVRPRTSPLLTEFHTRRGEAHVWTTFSADQVDLNWRNPDVFFEFLDIFLLYISHGARILRLDAVAFLWKKIGTNCLHLRQTHEVIKFFRDIFAVLAPHVLVLTETNVPHEENISYFGDGDEAHMVYNFSLPPLLLHALLRGDTTELVKWAQSLPTLPGNCTFFNFTASHDGIGVRPLQGILSREELDFLVGEVERKGGKVSSKSNPDGSTSPYELNITYYSALADAEEPENNTSQDRFMVSQLAALAVRGMPAVYFHSLTATLNHHEGVKESGANRSINRRKWQENELKSALAEENGHHRAIFDRYTDALRRRGELKAFHPNAGMEIIDIGKGGLLIKRVSLDQKQVIHCAHNFRDQDLTIDADNVGLKEAGLDLLTDQNVPVRNGTITLAPYEVRWIVASE